MRNSFRYLQGSPGWARDEASGCPATSQPVSPEALLWVLVLWGHGRGPARRLDLGLRSSPGARSASLKGGHRDQGPRQPAVRHGGYRKLPGFPSEAANKSRASRRLPRALHCPDLPAKCEASCPGAAWPGLRLVASEAAVGAERPGHKASLSVTDSVTTVLPAHLVQSLAWHRPGSEWVSERAGHVGSI